MDCSCSDPDGSETPVELLKGHPTQCLRLVYFVFLISTVIFSVYKLGTIRQRGTGQGVRHTARFQKGIQYVA